MKNFITSLLFIFIGSFCYAQFSFEGSPNHGVVSNFAYHHTDENTFYASIQNKLLKTTDNGETWSVIYSSPEFTEIIKTRVLGENQMVFQENYGYSVLNNLVIMNLSDNSIAGRIHIPTEFGSVELTDFDVMASDPDVAFLNLSGTSSKGYGVYTTDGGETWTTVYVNEDYPDKIGITSLAVSSQNPEKLVITRESGNIGNNFEGAGLWISEDAGETWVEHLENILLRKVAFNPEDDTEILAGTALRWNVTWQDQAVYRTTNNGEDWTEIDVEWDEGWGSGSLNYITGICFNPHQPGQIVILGDNEIVSTTDNGETWHNTTYPGGPSVNVESYFHATSVTFDPFNPDNLLIDNGYYPLKSEDGGITTERFLNPFYPVTGDVSLYHDEDQTDFYHGVQYGYVHRNLNTGEETDLGTYPLDIRFQFGAPIVRLKTDKTIPGRVFIYTTASSGIHLKVSDDYGENQEQIYQTSQYRYYDLTIDPENRSVIWLNLEDAFLASTLLRIDFSDIDDILTETISIPSGKLYAIEIDTENTDRVYAAVDNQLYLSEDAGETWTDITGELASELDPEDYILKIKKNPLDPEQFTLATSKGIFTSYDRGETWQELLEGDIFFVEHSDKENGHLVALAYAETGKLNFDIFYSEDMGEAWEKIDNEELHQAETNNSADAIFSEEAMRIYTGTVSLGPVSYFIDLGSLTADPIAASGKNFRIYPNPADDTVHFTGKTIPKKLSLFSVTGRQLRTVENSDSFSLADFSSGIYFIEIISEAGAREVHKIIKK